MNALSAATAFGPSTPKSPDEKSSGAARITSDFTTFLKMLTVQMRNQDGGPVRRDADFLAETNTLARADADRFVRPLADPHATLRNPALRTAKLAGDAPVTVYSEALAKGQDKYTGEFFGSARLGPATFGRHANFSKIIGDYSKDPSDE